MNILSKCFVIFSGPKDRSQDEPGSSRRSDGSSSGSGSGSPQEICPSPLQGYIQNLTDDEWMAFSSMLHTPMTRTQFAELCQAVLKVVSLSSITLILPAYVCVAKEAETSISRSSPTTFSAVTSTERSPSLVSCHSLMVTSPESLATDGDLMDDNVESESASSSLDMTQGPVTQMMLRMKGALARLQKTMAWYPLQEHTPAICDVHESAAQSSVSEPSHDQICIVRILENLLSSGNIEQIAKNLVGQVQGVLQDSGPTSVPVAASKSTSDSNILANRALKRTVSASQMVYSYAEVAIKDLLQPYLLPLVAWNAHDNVASSHIPISGMESIPFTPNPSGCPHTLQSSDAANATGSQLGLHKPECRCLVTSLIQRLPVNINYLETAEVSPPVQVTTSPSCQFSEVANLFTQVMTSQVMDIVDSELRSHAGQTKESPTAKDEPRIRSSPDKEEIEGSSPSEQHLLESHPGRFSGLFSGLIQRFLSEFRYSDSALSDAADSVRTTASSPVSQSARSESCEVDMTQASLKLKDMLGLFTGVMVSQVMDILHEEAKVELNNDQAKVAHITEMCSAGVQLHSTSSRPPSSKSADKLTALLSDSMTDGDVTVCDRDSELRKSSGSPSLVDPARGTDSSDNGCLVTVLTLRLLAKMRDQQANSPDMMGCCQDLIEKLLFEFSGASGTPNFLNYQHNIKMQTVFRTLDKFLQEKIGPETILQKSVNTQDASFDNILLTALAKELRHQYDPEVTAAPSAPSASPSSESVAGAAGGQTAKKGPKKRFGLKMRRRRYKKVSPTNLDLGQRVDTPAPQALADDSVMSVSEQKPRKRSFFMRMFTCCIRGSAES
ncbi:hypothetical protein ACEWY4_002971 [Coilia grayii]|uniref:Uncharacterized protein n=1 Tax=Coilia grayii TaxID=363190 RepID=A0ABD1KPW7_9TELE